MANTFPTTLNDFTNPSTSSDTATVSHAGQHTDANDAIEALEAKVGVNSSAVTSSLDYKVTSTSSSNPGHKHTLANGATDITASIAEVNVLDGIPATLTATELGYVDGVTSAIQGQIDAKSPIASPTFTGTVTLPVGLSGIASMASGVVSAVTAPSGTIVGTSDTQTLTAKRITKRTGTTTSSATPTINTDNVDFYSITAQAEAITSFTTNLSGTPTAGQTLWIAITGTAARAITWGSSFESSTVTLPTTTVTTNRLDVGFIWNSVTSKWRCVASA